MPLTAGLRLGPYEIVAPIGAGGMGEVYRARDVRLGRDVALKVLPERLANEPDALGRFEREARSIAALSHPNILAIFDFGHEAAITYAVTELLEGRTLREQLTSEGLPLRRGLEVARQMAAGLAAAHDKGIVHRDLKPENVFLTRDGSVKILDFGLASAPHRARADAATQADHGLRTGEGVVLGTVGYMAPEQIRGQEVDHRADIFAFGAVLYEILGGGRAFHADTAAEVLTAILRTDPPELTRSVSGLPPAIDRMVRRCLEKDPEHRFQSARDLGFALGAIGTLSDSGLSAEPAPVVAAPHAGRTGRRFWLLAALALVTALVTGAGIARSLGRQPSAAAAGPLAVFTFDAGFVFGPTVQVSPDGRHIAYTAPTANSTDATGTSIWIRHLDAVAPTALPTISDVPRDWSADSRYLLASNGNTLVKIDVATAQRTVLGQTPGLPRGAAWLPDGSVLAGTSRGIVRLRPGVTEASTVVAFDAERDTWVGWPSVLPGGRRFLYLALPKAGSDGDEVRIGSIEGGNDAGRRVGLQGVTAVTFLPPGALVYIKSRSLYVQAFDDETATTSADPTLIGRDVYENAAVGAGAASASSTGVIAYRSETFPQQGFFWVDRAGRTIQEFPKRDAFTNFDLAPDGTRVAVTVRRAAAAPNQLWLLDLTRGVATDISEASGSHSDPTWSPDGERLAFRLAGEVVIRAVNGGPTTRVLDRLAYPETWSPDGRYLVVGVPVPLTDRYELWTVDVSGRERPAVLVTGGPGLDEPRFSPDGRWIAYNGRESDRAVQVYAIPFPATGQRYQLSVAGGTQPRWRGDGRELFYLGTDGAVMSVQVPDGDVRRAAPPVRLFQAGLETSTSFDQFAPASNGQRFLLRRPREGGGDRAPLHVVVNFELKTRLAAEGHR